MIYSPLEHIINWLAPATCINCYSEGDALCGGCSTTIQNHISDRCVLCNKFTNNKNICLMCAKRTSINELYVGGVYDGLLKSCILSYKFYSNRVMGASLARLLGDRLPYFSSGETIVTFVPTTPSHIRNRGFDHAKRLANLLAYDRNIESTSLVQRIAYFEQRGKSRKVRLAQAKNSFSSTLYDLSGKTIILVEDVITTGATISSVAKQLHKMNAKTIVVAALAHGQY